MYSKGFPQVVQIRNWGTFQGVVYLNPYLAVSGAVSVQPHAACSMPSSLHTFAETIKDGDCVVPGDAGCKRTRYLATAAIGEWFDKEWETQHTPSVTDCPYFSAAGPAGGISCLPGEGD